jgi:tight adherence protein B
MLLLAVLIFLAVFALVAVVMGATGTNSTKQFQKSLDTALSTTFIPHDSAIADVRKNTVFSSIPWLNQLLSGVHPIVQLRRNLDQAGLKWTPSQVILAAAAAWAISAYAIYFRTRMAFISCLVATPVIILPFFFVAQKRSKRLALFRKKLPDTLDLMVSAMRAGFSMVAAFGHAANEAPEPIRREFRLCFEEQNFGVDLRTASKNLVERVPLQELRIVTTAMLINKDSGGNLAEVLEKTSSVIRQRFRLRQQIMIHTAQGRLTGHVLSVLPIALGVILYLINPEYMKLLFTTSLGRKISSVAFAMNVCGSLIIRKIVNIRI